jgi:hypothetical protein
LLGKATDENSIAGDDQLAAPLREGMLQFAAAIQSGR